MFNFSFFPDASDNSDSSEGEEAEPVESVAPRRNHYLIRSQRRRDRLVKTIDAALDPANYILIPPPTPEMRHEIRMTGDKQSGTKAKTVVWTTKPPPASRLAPQNIMSKPRSISREAQEAETPKQLWQLFFSDEMLSLIVQHTNEKIADDQERWTAERLQKPSYMKPIDKVKHIPYGTLRPLFLYWSLLLSCSNSLSLSDIP
jgi:hypothetical protein